MPEEAVLPIKLEPELRAAFLAEVAVDDRPASDVVRELMRGYDDYLRQKVEASRASMNSGHGRSNEVVEAEFAARRARTRAAQL